MAKLSGFQKTLALGSTSSAPRLFLPPEQFPIAILGSTLSALLEDTATAILGNTLSVPLLHSKHHECSLGKHLESACPYPTGENPHLIGSERDALLHRALTL